MNDNQQIFDKLYSADFQKKLITNPEKHLKDIGYTEDYAGVEFKIVKNSADKMYVVLAQPESMNDVDLTQVQAAGTTGTAGTGGTASTMGTICLCVSSASSAATVGTAGTH